jgi:hypothetical protein
MYTKFRHVVLQGTPLTILGEESHNNFYHPGVTLTQMHISYFLVYMQTSDLCRARVHIFVLNQHESVTFQRLTSQNVISSLNGDIVFD